MKITGGRRVAVALAVVALVPGVARAGSDGSALVSTMVVEVLDREAAADSLATEVERRGGYVALRTGEEVQLRVPVDQLDGLSRHAADLGVTVERKLGTRRLMADLSRDRAKLRSRETLLDEYFEVLRDADARGSLAVEREVTRLIDEIEELRGAIRGFEHRMRFAKLDVAFRFRDRSPPARDGSSSFAWINTVNLGDLLGGFEGGRR